MKAIEKKLYSWDESKKELNLSNDSNMLSHIQQGLQPYDEYGAERIKIPNMYHAYSVKLRNKFFPIQNIVDNIEIAINKLSIGSNETSITIEFEKKISDILGDSFGLPDSKRLNVSLKDIDNIRDAMTLAIKLQYEVKNELEFIDNDDINRVEWKYLEIPSTKQGIENLIKYLKKDNKVSFRSEDIDGFRKKGSELFTPGGDQGDSHTVGKKQETEVEMVKRLKQEGENDSDIIAAKVKRQHNEITYFRVACIIGMAPEKKGGCKLNDLETGRIGKRGRRAVERGEKKLKKLGL